MLLRRRGLLKYLFLIPTLWFATIIILSLRTTDTSTDRIDKDLVKTSDKNESLPWLIHRFMSAFQLDKVFADSDHPMEERHKALQQAIEMKGVVQVAAPGKEVHVKSANRSRGPGELGVPVRIKKDRLSPEELQQYKQGWRDNAFNEYASNMISVRRSLPDVRDPE